MNCTTYYRYDTFLLKVLCSSSRFYDVGYDWLVIECIGMRCGLLMAICLCLVSFSGYAATGKSDAQIKKEIIKESIESYPAIVRVLIIMQGMVVDVVDAVHIAVMEGMTWYVMRVMLPMK